MLLIPGNILFHCIWGESVKEKILIWSKDLESSRQIWNRYRQAMKLAWLRVGGLEYRVNSKYPNYLTVGIPDRSVTSPKQ